MPVVVVVPVKSFRHGKQRLAGALTDGARLSLGQALVEHVTTCCEQAGLLPLLVTGDDEVGTWAIRAGLPTIADAGVGLDGAAAAGCAWAMESNSTWIVLHADLPLLSSQDLVLAAGQLETLGSVIAPSADGGTSALGTSQPIEFAYGPASFHRHLARAPGAGVLTRTGLLHDLDSDIDLESALAHPRGSWLATVIGR